MFQIRRVIVLSVLAALAALGLYGCGVDTPTPTPVPPLPTAPPVPPSATPMLPTATPVPPTITPLPPTATDTAVPPSPTASPSATHTPLPPTATRAAATRTHTPAAPIATKTPAAANPVDAIGVMRKSAQAMKSVKSVHLIAKIEGGPFPGAAQGDVIFPDHTRIVMDTAQGKTEAILIGQETYIKLEGSEAYTALPLGLFPSDISQSLRGMDGYIQYAQGATVVGGEKVDGVDTTHVKFTFDPDKVRAFYSGVQSAPAAQPKLANGEMWIDKSTGYLRSYRYDVDYSGGVGAPQPGVITVTYSRFNQVVTPPIEKPANVVQFPGMGAATPTP